VQNVSSLGGILVWQEIKVAISQAKETDTRSLDSGRQPQDQGLSLSQGDDSHSRTKADAGNQFELKLISKTNMAANVEQTLGSTAVASGSANEVMTFVDELFSSCVERR
jgi:hypothetical protein